MHSKSLEFHVKKASGATELFDVVKLQKSLHNAGANPQLINSICDEVFEKAYDGISTNEIYKIAFASLKKENHLSHIKYKLKNALFNLGESGFTFEKLMKAVFLKMGYEVMLDVMLPGKCVNHEVDVVAENEREIVLVECKYSENRKKIIGIQTPLYVVARMQDIMQSWGKDKKKPVKKMLATNSKFSFDSLQYAECENLEMRGWNTFSKETVSQMIEKNKVYPISILPGLSRKQLDMFYEQGIITCSELNKYNHLPHIESELGRNKKQITKELEIILSI